MGGGEVDAGADAGLDAGAGALGRNSLLRGPGAM